MASKVSRARQRIARIICKEYKARGLLTAWTRRYAWDLAHIFWFDYPVNYQQSRDKITASEVRDYAEEDMSEWG